MDNNKLILYTTKFKPCENPNLLINAPVFRIISSNF